MDAEIVSATALGVNNNQRIGREEDREGIDKCPRVVLL